MLDHLPLTPLSAADRDDLDRPTYDPATLRAGIVHFGVGAFHRAHQAVYLHELAQRGVDGWGVIGVALHSRDAKAALEDQDHRYTVLERGDEDRLRVIGSLGRVLHAPDEPGAVLDALADPAIRLVTLTVSQDGYPVDPVSGELRTDASEVVHDHRHPGRPRTFAGFLVTALARRRAAGDGPLTVLSCDNVPDGGAVTRACVVGLARLRDPALAAWIEAHVAFPGCMADRIAPRSAEDAADHVLETYGVIDRAPVTTEPYREWIVEDRFSAGRPPLERVGVRFVADVRPHALMKRRMLNGTHCALAYVGLLAGHRTCAEVLDDPLLHRYVDRLMAQEIAPTLLPVPGVDPARYRRTLLRRFANPALDDELERVGRRGSAKVPSLLVPCVQAAREAGRPHELLTLALAAWLRLLRGTDLDGEPVALADARMDELRRTMARSGWDPRVLLADRQLFGDLATADGFAAELGAALRSFDERGVHRTVSASLR